MRWNEACSMQKHAALGAATEPNTGSVPTSPPVTMVHDEEKAILIIIMMLMGRPAGG